MVQNDNTVILLGNNSQVIPCCMSTILSSGCEKEKLEEAIPKMSRQSVVVTGCSVGGFGYALAKAFHEAGCRVYATARDTAKVGSLASEDNIEIIELDVTSSDSITSCVAQVHKETNGKLDVLVNNAGGAIFGPLVHTSIAESKAVYDVNVWGSLATAQAFAPLVIQANGVILNISSMAGAVPMAWQGTIIYTKSSEVRLGF